MSCKVIEYDSLTAHSKGLFLGSNVLQWYLMRLKGLVATNFPQRNEGVVTHDLIRMRSLFYIVFSH